MTPSETAATPAVAPAPAPLRLPDGFRAAMPVAERWVYYDHAAVGPLSGPAREALRQWTDVATCDGDVRWLEWLAAYEQLRRNVAERLGADEREIAFVGNTTDGIGIVAEGLAWESGDNIVLPAGEFPSNHYAWKRLADRGVELRIVPVGPRGDFGPQEIRSRCDARTRLIATSWVGFASGFRCDVAGIAEVARQTGARFLLDAIQGLGVFPLDLSSLPIDFVVADGHKWLLGPEGFGLLYVRRERQEEVRPTRIGWNSVRNPFDYQRLDLEFRDDARRYEGGSANFAAAHALAASLELLGRSGWSATDGRLADRVLTATDDLVERIRAAGASVHSDRRPEHASGIVSFSFADRDPVALRKRLLERGVVTSCRAGRLRAAVHGYNDASDAERFETALIDALTDSRPLA